MLTVTEVTAVDVLRDVRALLDDPEHWTQGQNARRADGTATDLDDDAEAVCWCLYGAYGKVCHDKGLTLHDDTYWAAQRALRQALPRRNLQQWNDAKKRTHAEIVALVDRAIEIAAGAA